MKTARFFVTSVVILGMAALSACNVSHQREARGQAEKERKDSLAKEGNAKIQAAEQIRADLEKKFNLHIATVPRSKDKTASAFAVPEKYSFKDKTLQERREIQGQLAKYLQLIQRVLEIDSMRLMTVENRDMLVIGRENAEAFQRALELVEGKLGENFQPKTQPTVRRLVKNEN